MTAPDFNQWLAAMKAAGLAKSDAACARALGIHVNTILVYKWRGTDQSTALACAALLRRLRPYPEEVRD